MERRTIAADVKMETREGEKPRISGYAAVFYDGTPGTEYKLWDNAVERILPGAFSRATREDDVRGLFNHDPNCLLGRKSANTLAVAEDQRGLWYSIDPPDTQPGRDVTALLARGDLKGSSFSFTVTDETWEKENGVRVRKIRGAKLFDVGPVTFPAYEGTTAGMRSEDIAEARSRCEAWETEQRKAAEAADAAASASIEADVVRAREVCVRARM